MIKFFFNQFLEKSLNQLLSLREDNSILRQHNGKALKIVLSDFSANFFLVLRNEKIYFYTMYSHEVDTIIRGTSFNFLKQLRPKNQLPDLAIEGDIEFAEAMQSLLRDLNINWQEYVAFFVGDFITQKADHLMNTVKKTFSYTKDRSIADVIEYIQEEQRFAPSREEIEDFYEDITLLRQDIDRLEARFNRIKEKMKQ